MSRPISIHPDDTFRLQLNWTAWLRGQSISSVAYDPSTTGATVANNTVAGDVSTAYITCPNLALNEEFTIDITCTTTASPARVKTVTKAFRVVETRL